MEWENSMLQLILDIYVPKLLSDHSKHVQITPQVERKKKKVMYSNVEKSHKSARVSPML